MNSPRSGCIGQLGPKKRNLHLRLPILPLPEATSAFVRRCLKGVRPKGVALCPGVGTLGGLQGSSKGNRSSLTPLAVRPEPPGHALDDAVAREAWRATTASCSTSRWRMAPAAELQVRALGGRV